MVQASLDAASAKALLFNGEFSIRFQVANVGGLKSSACAPVSFSWVLLLIRLLGDREIDGATSQLESLADAEPTATVLTRLALSFT